MRGSNPARDIKELMGEYNFKVNDDKVKITLATSRWSLFLIVVQSEIIFQFR